jgi:hypothetical protein
MLVSDRLKKFCTTPYKSLKENKTWGNLARRSGRRVLKRFCEKMGHKPLSDTGKMTKDESGKDVPVYRTGGYRESRRMTRERHGSRSRSGSKSRSMLTRKSRKPRYGIHRR